MILPVEMPRQRAGGAASAVMIGSFALFSVMPLLRGRLWYAALGALGLLLALALWPRGAQAFQLSALCLLAPLCSWLLPEWVIWPFPYGLALLLAGALLWSRPALRPSIRWLRRGRLGRSELLLVAAATLASSTALVAWFLLLRPDLADLSRMIPAGTPMWLIVLGAIGFSMCNAAIEEAVWRGVLLEGLHSIAPAALAVTLQAISFGIAHVHGFPRGAIGIGLAAIYGVMLGVIRVRANGMLAPWIAHLFADLTIIFILATLAL